MNVKTTATYAKGPKDHVAAAALEASNHPVLKEVTKGVEYTTTYIGLLRSNLAPQLTGEYEDYLNHDHMASTWVHLMSLSGIMADIFDYGMISTVYVSSDPDERETVDVLCLSDTGVEFMLRTLGHALKRFKHLHKMVKREEYREVFKLVKVPTHRREEV